MSIAQLGRAFLLHRPRLRQDSVMRSADAAANFTSTVSKQHLVSSHDFSQIDTLSSIVSDSLVYGQVSI